MMNEFEKKVDGIREFYRGEVANRYPLENDMLKNKDEYTKSLYIRMLCALVQYKGNVKKMQTMYLQRIMKGTECEEQIGDYMKKALDISRTDIDSFISSYENDLLRFTFCIDGMILLSIGEREADEPREFLAELAELLRVTKAELLCLSNVARSVLEQNGETYDKARGFWQSTMKELNLSFYLKDYYDGAISDTQSEKYYYANEKKKFKFDQIKTEFKGRKVRFENLIIKVGKKWSFEGCNEVEFINCDIIGDKFPLHFEHVKTMKVRGCKIQGFKNRFAEVLSVDEIFLNEDCFDNCGTSSEWRGGVLTISGDNERFEVHANQFVNCYLTGPTCGAKPYGVIAFSNSKEADATIVDNEFINCYCQTNEKKAYLFDLDNYKTVEERNVCAGIVSKIVMR